MDPFKPFTIGHYVCKGGKQSLLGKGSFADVFIGYDTRTNNEVAIKVVDVTRLTKGNRKLMQHLASEVQIMKTLEHENIVRLFDVYMPSDVNIYMVFEFCSGGDLAKYIQKHNRLSEATAQKFMRHLASGLKFLRSKNIIHRDLKPQNLLLSSRDDNSAVLKIADFGFARFIEPQSLAETLCGSPLYMAPEILMLQQYSVKSDLWSVGIIMYESLVGATPFAVKSPLELINMIDRKPLYIPEKELGLSKDCVNLLENLLQKDPLKRMSWEEFFLHPWLNLHSILSLDELESLSLEATLAGPIHSSSSSSSVSSSGNLMGNPITGGLGRSSLGSGSSGIGYNIPSSNTPLYNNNIPNNPPHTPIHTTTISATSTTPSTPSNPNSANTTPMSTPQHPTVSNLINASPSTPGGGAPLSSSPYTISAPILISTRDRSASNALEPPFSLGSPRTGTSAPSATSPGSFPSSSSYPNRSGGSRSRSNSFVTSPGSPPVFPEGLPGTSPFSRSRAITSPEGGSHSAIRMPKTNPFKDSSLPKAISAQHKESHGSAHQLPGVGGAPFMNTPPFAVTPMSSPSPNSAIPVGAAVTPVTSGSQMHPASTTSVSSSTHYPSMNTTSASIPSASATSSRPEHAAFSPPEHEPLFFADPVEPDIQLPEVELRCTVALIIATVGELKLEQEHWPEALGLYTKALTMLHQYLHKAKRAQSHSKSLAESLQWDTLLTRYRPKMASFLKKADYIKQWVKPSDASAIPEKLIYDFALHLGREGAVSELLKNYDKSEKYYENALLLFNYLLLEIRNEQDKEVLQNFASAVSKRLNQVRTAKSRLLMNPK